MLQARQLAEHRGTVLRIVMRDDLAHGLVIGDDTRRRRVDAKADGLAIDLDLVAELDALAHMGRLVVDRDAAFKKDRKSTRLNSSHLVISYAVFCLQKN